jgi:predicted polyphosphate/ATP-dependent NAD kinase
MSFPDERMHYSHRVQLGFSVAKITITDDDQAGTCLRIGFLVNPVAGMGGRVGLKGTDHVSAEAIALGAKPVSPVRAIEFLKKLKQLELASKIEFLTCPGVMGQNEMRDAGFEPEILSKAIASQTSAEDTKASVRLMTRKAVDLIIFVGGDGTAKDIYDAMNAKSKALVLGVPSGVKMYSGIFAASVLDAVEVVQAFVNGETQTTDFEIVDADEEAIRGDRFSTRLYGFLKGPFVPMRLLGSKHISPETFDELENQKAVARFIVEEMKSDGTYILGPGSTVKCVADLLGVEKTLLGVDLYQEKNLIKDVNEKRILKEVKDWKNTWLVLSPIGRQGVLLGRGNQQISPDVIRRIGKEHVIVGATRNKIQGIDGGVLRVDTGDPKVDKMLRGYVRVAIDYREWRLLNIV